MTGENGSTDHSLAFGLLLTPKRIRRPITDQLEGTSFSKLESEAAAFVLEGVIYLQWIKAAVVGGLCVLVAYWLRDGSGAFVTAVLWIVSAAIMWLPIYMIILSAPCLVLRRSKDVGQPMVASHPAIPSFVRIAPVLAAIPALLLAFVSPIVPG